jgi:hypothetical protein
MDTENMTRFQQECRVASCAVLLFLLALAACDSGPTQATNLRLSAAEARPYQMLSVDGLPAATANAVIRVGDEETPLVYDPVAATHHFLVPPQASGSVRVRIPASATGDGEAVLRLQVLPTQFTGGSPAAEIARMDSTLNRLRANVASALDSLGPAASPSLVALGANLRESAALMAEMDPQMTAADRVTLAGIYAANRPLFELVANHLDPARPATAMNALARDDAAQVAGLPTAESVAQRCIQANLRLEAATDLLKAASYFHLALPAILTLTVRSPAITARVALFTNAFVVGLHSAILVQSRQPRFFDADGLRLEPSRIKVRENGGTGELRAYLKMVGAKNAADRGDLAYGKSVADFGKHYRNMNNLRQLTDWEALRGVLRGYSLSKVIQLMDEALRLLDEIYEDADDTEGSREIPIAMDGLEIGDVNNTGLWEFTSPASGNARQFRTRGQVRRDLGYEIIALHSTAGRGEACTARTHDTNPQEGRNGFLITGPPILRSASYDLVSVGTCSTNVGTGSLFNIRVNYFAANTMGPRSRVDVTWSFDPSGNAGSYSVVNNSNDALGTQGTFAFGYCARYNDDRTTSIRFTATDPEGLQSNALSLSIPKQSGTPELRANPGPGAAAAGSATLVPAPAP